VLRITLKVAPRTSRQLEIPVTEEELGDLRREYWTGRPKDVPDDDSLATSIIEKIDNGGAYEDSKFDVKEWLRLIKAVTSLSLWVEGIYWYKDRTPPASKHTRVRAFFDSEGDIHCPKCDLVLCEDFETYVEDPPVDYSKTLNNPRFICPHCNSLVMVSQRSSAYRKKPA